MCCSKQQACQQWTAVLQHVSMQLTAVETHTHTSIHSKNMARHTVTVTSYNPSKPTAGCDEP